MPANGGPAKCKREAGTRRPNAGRAGEAGGGVVDLEASTKTDEAREGEFRELEPVTVRCGTCASKWPGLPEATAGTAGSRDGGLGPKTGGTPLGLIIPPPEPGDDSTASRLESGPECGFVWYRHLGPAEREGLRGGSRTRGVRRVRRGSSEYALPDLADGSLAASAARQLRLPAYMSPGGDPPYLDTRNVTARWANTPGRYAEVRANAQCRSITLECHRCRSVTPDIPLADLGGVARAAQARAPWWKQFYPAPMPSSPDGRTRVVTMARPHLAVWLDPKQRPRFSLAPPGPRLDSTLLWRWPWDAQPREARAVAS